MLRDVTQSMSVNQLHAETTDHRPVFSRTRVHNVLHLHFILYAVSDLIFLDSPYTGCNLFKTDLQDVTRHADIEEGRIVVGVQRNHQLGMHWSPRLTVSRY